MSSALLAVLFATLGTGLVGTSTVCFVLWRKVRALARPPMPRVVSVSVPGSTGSPDRKPVRARPELARRVDELLARQRALEARLAKVEAISSGQGAPRPAARPGGPKGPRQRFDLGVPSSSGGPPLISVPDLAAPSAPTWEAAAELDRRFGPVWAMADDAVPIDAIARETGYPIGQVELILGLRRQLLAPEARPDA